MNSTVLTVLTLSASGSVIALLLLAIRPLIKNRVSKAFLYYVWLVVLLRLALPFAAPEVNLMGALVSAPTGTPQTQAAEPPAPETQMKPQTDIENAVYPSPAASVQPYATVPQAGTADNADTAASGFDLLGLIKNNLLWIWLAGTIVCFGWFLSAYAVFTHQLKRSLRQPNAADETVFDDMRGNRHVRLMVSSVVVTPMLIGILRPVIVVPQLAYVRNGMEDALRYILRHELEHDRRKDVIYKWVCVAVTSAHWFNPLMLMIRKQIGTACELACDEAVIRSLTRKQMRDYGNTLLALSASRRLPSGVLATTLCEGKKELKERLTSIMKYKQKTVVTTVLSVVLALLLAGCGAALGTAAKEKTPDNGSTVTINEEPAPTAENDQDVTSHKMTFKGESDLWTGELTVDCTDIFHTEDGTLYYDSEDKSSLTVAYKGDLSQLDDSTRLRIEFEGWSMEQTGDISNQPFKMHVSSGSIVARNADTADVKIKLNGEDQSLTLKMVENADNSDGNGGTSSANEVTAVPQPADNTWRSKFPDKFGETQSTENSYKSHNINVSVEKFQQDDVTYYVADIYIAELKYLQTAFSGGEYGIGKNEWQLDLAKEKNAVVSISGDFYIANSQGTVLRNGMLYRTEPFEDVCVLSNDGTMQTFSPEGFDIETVKAHGAWQIWSFGPMLLKDGKAIGEFNSTVAPKNPRAAIGYYEPGHYCFVAVDGRQKDYSVGMTLEELSQLFEALGCETAYNLDGGQSAAITFGDSLASHPYNGGRQVSDIIYIGEK